MRRDSYFLVVSCTSLLLYAICLYTFLHLNGYIGVKNLVSVSSPSTVTGARHLDPNDVDKNSLFAAPYLKSQAQFDDGKIHEFQRNVGHPVDWEMRVKGNHFYNPRLPSFFNLIPSLVTFYTLAACSIRQYCRIQTTSRYNNALRV